jgi:hypothetical protein
MKLILEKEEAIEIIYSALCNGGLAILQESEVILNVSPEDYKQAKYELIETSKVGICLEDVYVQILRSGKSLCFFDNNEEANVQFDINKAIEEMSKEAAFNLVLAIKNEEDDAYTGWELLQICLYGEIIYG